MSDSVIQERFVVLEMKVAYQDKLIAELNEVLLERGRQVDRLLAKMEHVQRFVRDGPPQEATNEPPPHY